MDMGNDLTQIPKQADILIVDDSVNSLKLLVDLLSSQGYHIRPAANGDMALRSATESIPDLILLDVKMPDMDGHEVCRRLKADEKLRQIPVIFISGIENKSSKIKGFDVGGIDYITKPFDSEEVLARVRIHLELRSLQIQLEHRVHERTVELTHAYQALKASEIRFRDLFENSPVSLWEGDLSQVNAFIERLRDKKVDHLEAYLDAHPQAVMRCARQIELFDVNQAALELFGPRTNERCWKGWPTRSPRNPTRPSSIFFYRSGTVKPRWNKRPLLQDWMVSGGLSGSTGRSLRRKRKRFRGSFFPSSISPGRNKPKRRSSANWRNFARGKI
nr:response regulator [Desulfosarcina cetonica]